MNKSYFVFGHMVSRVLMSGDRVCMDQGFVHRANDFDGIILGVGIKIINVHTNEKAAWSILFIQCTTIFGS